VNPHRFIYVSFFLFQLPVHATMPLGVLRLSELGVEPAAAGVILGLSGLLPALIAVPAGQLTDRFGALVQAAVASLICIVGFAGLSLVRTPLLVAVGLALVGLGHTAGVLAYQSFVASSEGIANRVQAFGWISAVISLAQSLGPAGAGLLADQFTLTTVFGLSSVIASLSLVGVSALRTERTAAVAALPAAGMPVAVGKSWWQYPSLLFAVTATLLFALSYNVRLSFLPLYLEAIGHTTTEIGILFSVQALAGLAVRSRIGWVSTTFGEWWVMMVVFLASVPVFALIPTTVGFSTLLALSLLLGVGNGMMHPVTLAVATTAVPYDRQGMALGLRYAAFRFGSTTSPLLLSLAVAVLGLAGAFLAAAVLAGIGAAGALLERWHSTARDAAV
jgi:MFS family permease